MKSRIVILLAVTLLGTQGASAQNSPTVADVLGEKPEAAAAPPAAPPAADPIAAGPIDDFDRGNPRSMAKAFDLAIRDHDWETAAEYLDLRNLPREMRPPDGPALAEDLAAVLDRTLWIDLDSISAKPEGRLDDGLPKYRERVGVIDTPDGKVEVLLQRVPRGDGVSIWKVSNHTVKDIPLLRSHFHDGPLAEYAKALVPDVRVFGFELWRLTLMAGLLFLAFLVAWTVSSVLAFFVRRSGTAFAGRCADFVNGPIRLMILVALYRGAIDLLGPTLELRALLSAQTLPILVCSWAVLRGFDLFFDHLIEQMRNRQEAGLVVFARPIRNATRVVVVLLAGLIWLENLGFSITTLMAGVGVGGVAIALAAQSSMEDVLGAITVFASRPVRIGDFCRFGTAHGTVEEIGLRRTRIRTLDDSIVSVPNAQLAKQVLENYGERSKFRYSPYLALRLDTSPEQLRFLLVELRRVLYAHPRVLEEPTRVRFARFGSHALEIDVLAYVDVPSYGDFLEVAEDLNLRVMEVVERAGTALTVPAQATVIEAAAPPDPERARAAEATVRDWREREELYLPAFPKSEVDALRDTIPYPPEGSPTPA